MQTLTPTENGTVAVECVSAADRPVRVFMMDLLSIVPYYSGHLVTALRKADGLRLELGAITYHLDPQFFKRNKIALSPGLMDFVSRFRTWPPSFRRIAKSAEYFLNLAALLLRFVFRKPDLIHVQFLPFIFLELPTELWFLKAAQSMRIKVVYTVHNVLPQDTANKHRATCQRVYDLADHLICHDEPAKRRLIGEFGITPDRITIIPHGPLFTGSPIGANNHVRERLGLSGDQQLVLWQGILRPYKGVSFLLKAWHKLIANGGAACLAIVGSATDDLARAVIDEVRTLGLQSSVKLELRFVSVEEMEQFYEAADILVYPYREITTSGALQTGMSRGKAIIATRLPAFEEMLIDGENALLVNYGDVDGLAHATGRLLKDSRLRAKLENRMRQTHGAASQWPEIAARTMKCYRGALANAKSKLP